MIGFSNGKVHQVFTRGSSPLIDDRLMIADEKIVILQNGLIYCIYRPSDYRRLYADIQSYIEAREEEQDGLKIVGLSDTFFNETITLPEVLISLNATFRIYNYAEMYRLMMLINYLFNEIKYVYEDVEAGYI